MVVGKGNNYNNNNNYYHYYLDDRLTVTYAAPFGRSAHIFCTASQNDFRASVTAFPVKNITGLKGSGVEMWWWRGLPCLAGCENVWPIPCVRVCWSFGLNISKVAVGNH